MNGEKPEELHPLKRIGLGRLRPSGISSANLLDTSTKDLDWYFYSAILV